MIYVLRYLLIVLYTVLWGTLALVLSLFDRSGEAVIWVARNWVRWILVTCGVRVEAFSVGFGRELLGFTDRHGTRFKLCLLPLGGYVKMFGEQGFMRDANGRLRLLDRHERERSFFHKSIGERAAIVFAGPLVNILFGGAVLAALIFANGLAVPSPTIGVGLR